MTKKIQLTPNSWLIRTGAAVTSGLLFRQDETYLFMSPGSRLEFASYEAVETKFGKIVEEVRSEEVIQSTIAGYPVKHTGITVISEKPPLYSKGGNVIFAAGYWGLKFTNGWTQAFCPKQKTCEEHESVGPFSNRLEMLNHLSTLNMTDNIQGR